MEALEPQLVGERYRDAAVELQAVLALRPRAPLREPAPDHVRADHAVPRRQVRRELVHVAAGAREAVPCRHGLGVLAAPFRVMDLAAFANQVPGNHRRRRPTMPDGK